MIMDVDFGNLIKVDYIRFFEDFSFYKKVIKNTCFWEWFIQEYKNKEVNRTRIIHTSKIYL